MAKPQFDKALPLNSNIAFTTAAWPAGTIVTPVDTRGAYLVMDRADPATTPKTAPLYILAHMSDPVDRSQTYPWAFFPKAASNVVWAVDAVPEQKLYLVAEGKWSNVPDKTGPRRVVGSVLSDNLINFSG